MSDIINNNDNDNVIIDNIMMDDYHHDDDDDDNGSLASLASHGTIGSTTRFIYNKFKNGCKTMKRFTSAGFTLLPALNSEQQQTFTPVPLDLTSPVCQRVLRLRQSGVQNVVDRFESRSESLIKDISLRKELVDSNTVKRQEAEKEYLEHLAKAEAAKARVDAIDDDIEAACICADKKGLRLTELREEYSVAKRILDENEIPLFTGFSRSAFLHHNRMGTPEVWQQATTAQLDDIANTIQNGGVKQLDWFADNNFQTTRKSIGTDGRRDSRRENNRTFAKRILAAMGFTNADAIMKLKRERPYVHVHPNNLRPCDGDDVRAESAHGIAASLDPETIEAIRQQNGVTTAEAWDTIPANVQDMMIINTLKSGLGVKRSADGTPTHSNQNDGRSSKKARTGSPSATESGTFFPDGDDGKEEEEEEPTSVEGTASA